MKVILSIEEMIKITKKYGIDTTKVKKRKCSLFYLVEDGSKVEIKLEDFIEDMKSIHFMMTHELIMVDNLVGNIITEGIDIIDR